MGSGPALGHVSAPSLDHVHQALSHKHPDCFARRLPRYFIALHQRGLARNGPVRHEFTRLDLGTQDRRYLLIDRLRPLVIDGHAVTLPSQPGRHPYAPVYRRMPLSSRSVECPRTTERARRERPLATGPRDHAYQEAITRGT